MQEAPDSLPPAETASAQETDNWTYQPISYPLTAEDATLSLWMTMQLSPNSAYDSMTEHPFVEKFHEATGVGLDLRVQSMENGADQTQLMLAGGDYPDLMLALSYASGYSGAIEEEVILDLADYDLGTNAPDYYKKLLDTDTLKEVITDEGQIPALAVMNNGARGPESGIIVHKEMLEALNLDTPETYDEFENVLTAIKSSYGIEEPLFMDPSGVIDNNSFAVGYGVKLYLDNSAANGGLYLEDGQVKFGYVEQGFTDYITMMNRWYQAGLISRDYLSSTSAEASENIIGDNIAGQVGMFVKFDGLIDLVATLAGGDTQLKALADPTVNAGAQIHLGNAQSMADASQGLVVTTACSDPVLALQALNWLYTDDGFRYLNYGVEGETYTMVDGKPVWTDFIAHNENGKDSTTMISDYTGGGVITINKDTQMVNSTFSPNAQEAAGIWGSNKDGQWELPGALTLTAQEQETYSRIMSDIVTSCMEYTNKFIIGDAPLSDIPAFQQNLWDMGLQEVLDVYSSAVERYENR